MQAPSGGVQIPQLALQQTMPASHVPRPHGVPPAGAGMGTQRASRSCDSHADPCAHVVAAHGWVPETHRATEGHGERRHVTVCRSQNVSSEQLTPSHVAGPSGGVAGAGTVAVEALAGAGGGSSADAGEALALTSLGAGEAGLPPQPIATPPKTKSKQVVVSCRFMTRS